MGRCKISDFIVFSPAYMYIHVLYVYMYNHVKHVGSSKFVHRNQCGNIINTEKKF